MNKAKTLLKRLISDRALALPIILLLTVAAVIISSYLLAGWLMRPVGDDYASIMRYHQQATWWKELPNFVISDGGRYGQTFVAVAWYGALGQTGLKLTAFVSIGLFLLASYLVILAVQKVKGMTLNHKYALIGASLLFAFYTMISVTFPWIRGNIDNTFQNFLWLPGLITYTLPLELLAITVASAILLPQIRNRKIGWLIGIGLISVFTGTFSEIIPILYTEFMVLFALYHLVAERFRIRAFLQKRLLAYVPFLVIEAGLLLGLMCNYLSKATAQRRALFNQQGTTSEIISHSVTSTKQYLSTYVFGSQANDSREIVFIILASIAVALIGFNWLRIRQTTKQIKQAALLCALFGFMTLTSIFLSFAILFKGYGISPYTYLVPRFEIVYNVWFTLFLIFLGVLIATILAFVAARQKLRWVTPVVSIAASIFVLCSVPNILTQATQRMQHVAVFSASWDYQDAELRQDATEKVPTATVPMIDIGDAYNVKCQADSSSNWLGVLKQNYYHVAMICSTPE